MSACRNVRGSETAANTIRDAQKKLRNIRELLKHSSKRRPPVVGHRSSVKLRRPTADDRRPKRVLLLCMVSVAVRRRKFALVVSDDRRPTTGDCRATHDLERDKSIRWMPWHQEAMKDVARCEKPWGAASRL